MPIELDGLRRALGGFGQVEDHFTLHVAAFASPPSPAAAAAKQVAEKTLAQHVAEGLENIAHVAEMRRLAALQALKAVAIVLRPLFRVVQDLEGLGRLFEPGDCRLVARVAVGMVFQRQFAVGLGNLLALAERSTPRIS